MRRQPHDHVEPLQPLAPSTPESERRYPKLSDEEKEALFDDLAEYLRITKAFKLFGDKNSGNSTIN